MLVAAANSSAQTFKTLNAFSGPGDRALYPHGPLATGPDLIAFVVLTGISTMFVALCFAEAGSRFERTGGAYIYTRAAFGRFVGFEVGWMQWFTRATSQASVVNGIALAVAFYWSSAAQGLPRAAIITLLTCALAVVNVAGLDSA